MPYCIWAKVTLQWIKSILEYFNYWNFKLDDDSTEIIKNIGIKSDPYQTYVTVEN